MANTRVLQRSFGGGEISPEMFGRIDDIKYQSGLATCRNFIIKPQGPAENRAGLQFVREVKTSSRSTRVIPFTYSTTQTMVIEVGAGYFRFHTQGETLLVGSAATAWAAATAYAVGALVSNGAFTYYCVSAHTSTTFAADVAAGRWYTLPTTGEYEIPNPYAEADLFDIHYVQSADVMTLVHPNYPPMQLERLGATEWVLAPISFASTLGIPGGVTGSATVGATTSTTSSGSDTSTTTSTTTTLQYSYVVTACDSNGLNESSQSAAVTLTNNLLVTGSYNVVSWNPVAGAAYYNVYRLNGGLYGFIGQTANTTITDADIAPDASKTPPIYDTVFTTPGNYPGAVSYFEQRRIFAGTTDQPQNVWMTRSGTESNMSYSLPTRDDDRIAFRVAARDANTIRHIVPLTSLLMLTSGAEWVVRTVNSDALTPTSVSVAPQSYIGASNVQPEIINNTILYVAARGGHVRELGYNWQVNGFITDDVSLRAAHLFDTLDIVDMAYAKAPQPIVWFVSTNGNLLGFTYVPEQQIGAWHRHDTINGTFESCAAVAEGVEDMLYVVVNRNINGVQKRYIERLASRQFSDQQDAFFVDCGATYSSPAPVTTISGLTWLEGQTVNILADGAVMPQQTVTDGAITLQQPASIVQIGLPITADLQTLPLAAAIDSGYAQGRYKNVNKAWLRVYQSSGIWAGPTADRLVEVKQRTNEPYGSPPALQTGEIPLVLPQYWGDSGEIFVQQTDPLPLTLVSMTVEVAMGA